MIKSCRRVPMIIFVDDVQRLARNFKRVILDIHRNNNAYIVNHDSPL